MTRSDFLMDYSEMTSENRADDRGNLLKKTASMMADLLTYPFYLIYLFFSLFCSSNTLFMAFSQTVSLFPGLTGSYLRAAFYRRIFPNCSRNVTIHFGTLFSQVDTMIGDYVYIGPQCNIGACRISDGVIIGSQVQILSGRYQHGNEIADAVRLRDQPGRYTPVSIGAETWIGNGSIIMENIGNHATVGAGAVVVKPVPDYAVVAGNPAVIINYRK